MAKAKASPKHQITKPGPTTVSNLPESAEMPISTKSLIKPSTLGRGTVAPTGNDGLESVEGYRRVYATGPTPESVSAAPAPSQWVPPTKMLPDVGEASFGPPPPQPETVHGPDDRIQINNTNEYPWSAIASLLITARDNSTWIGTGWFVSPRTLITAGHCVYIKNSSVPGRDGWVRSIQVMAGRNGESLPFDVVTSTVFKSVPGWTESGDENFDYGAIILPVPLGETVGVFGTAVYPDADLEQSVVNVSGYPGDKPSARNGTIDVRSPRSTPGKSTTTSTRRAARAEPRFSAPRMVRGSESPSTPTGGHRQIPGRGSTARFSPI